MGWFTVGAYLLTFFLAALVVRKTDRSRRASRLFWMFITILMLFLAVNKQLDLQSFATALARCVSKAQGWYHDRWAFQQKVVLALGAGAMLIGLLMLWKLGRDLARNWLALFGVIFVFGFVLIRAVGWHEVDALINTRILYVRLNWALELSGLILISLNAAWLLRYAPIDRPRRRRRRSLSAEEEHARYRRERRRRTEQPEKKFSRNPDS